MLRMGASQTRSWLTDVLGLERWHWRRKPDSSLRLGRAGLRAMARCIQHRDADKLLVAISKKNALVFQIDRFRGLLGPSETDVQHVGLLVVVQPELLRREAADHLRQGQGASNDPVFLILFQRRHRARFRLMRRTK
jgi:hypothetical protein